MENHETPKKKSTDDNRLRKRMKQPYAKAVEEKRQDAGKKVRLHTKFKPACSAVEQVKAYHSNIKPPELLYRVQYDGTMTVYDNNGLNARDTHTDCSDESYDLGTAVERHLNWDKENPSVFISLFSERTHAENWLRSVCPNGKVIEIDAEKLGLIYKAQDLVDKLGLVIPEIAKPSVSKEWLAVHRVPRDAILDVRTIKEIEKVASHGHAQKNLLLTNSVSALKNCAYSPGGEDQ